MKKVLWKKKKKEKEPTVVDIWRQEAQKDLEEN